ncbi:hypothetical protein ACFLZ9_02005 [Patescibacteria group bacterium]
MFKKAARLIHNLRMFFLLFIIASFFYIYSINPIDLGKFLGAKFGHAVGVSTSVPENPFNKLALELKEKEDRLNQREEILTKKELELNSLINIGENKLVLFLIAGILVLFILVIFNYYLDYRRRKDSAKED